MARIRRQLSSLRFLTSGLANVPAMVRCARLFRNWRKIIPLYMGAAELVPPFVAAARKGFTVTHWEPSDVQTTWVVFCRPSYKVPERSALVLDLGANIGVFSIYATRLLGA